MLKADVVIVGAGIAGVCAAHALAGRGSRVMLIDRLEQFPDALRAEKIEADQAEILRRLGLLDARRPKSPPIGDIVSFDGETRKMFDTVEQYGICYGDTVNNLRDALPDGVELVTDRVAEVAPDDRAPSVTLQDGTRISASIVVLATGTGTKLTDALGIRYKEDDELRSLTFGCDIRHGDGRAFDFNGFNYTAVDNDDRIDYLSIFPIGERMRVNLFTQLRPGDALVQQARKDVLSAMAPYFPKLNEEIGEIEVCSDIQVVPTNYRRVVNPALAGVVILGEAFQTVSPATGCGLSKVLTDVELFATRYADDWMRNGPSLKRMKAFYRDPAKQKSDNRALESWLYYCNRHVKTQVPLLRRLGQSVRLRLSAG